MFRVKSIVPKSLTNFVFFILGLVSFIPVFGVVGVDVFQDIYGMNAEKPEVALLMQHRAMLFGIAGGVMMVASFEREMRVPAIVMASLSITGFLVLYLVTGIESHPVMRLDAIALLLLAVTAVSHFRQQQTEELSS